MPVPGERGGSWVAVALDTTAPLLSAITGHHSHYQPGESYSVTITLSEPTITDAYAIVNDVEYELAVDQTDASHYHVYGTLPDEEDPDAYIAFALIDDVDNERLVTRPFIISATYTPGDVGDGWVAIELDTHPPVLEDIEGHLSAYAAGDPYEATVTLDEPSLLTASIVVGADSTPLDIAVVDEVTYTISGTVPDFDADGNVTLVVRDDVWNQDTLLVPIVIHGGETPLVTEYFDGSFTFVDVSTELFPQSYTFTEAEEPPPVTPAPGIPGPFGPAVGTTVDLAPVRFTFVDASTDTFYAHFLFVNEGVKVDKVTARFTFVDTTTDSSPVTLAFSDAMMRALRDDDDLLLIL